MSRLIHLIFIYRLGFVGLELTQNICEGRGIPMVQTKYRKIFQNEKPSQTLNNSTIKVIEPEQTTRPKWYQIMLLYSIKNYYKIKI